MAFSSDIVAVYGLPALPEPLPAPCVDAHTHMDSVTAMTGLSVADNLALARDVGITRMVQIGCDVADSKVAESLARDHSEIIAAVAIHPNEAARLSRADLEDAWAVIDELAGAGPHVRAIGETGIDRFRTRDEQGIAQQKESFARHIQIAKDHGLTLAIHDRDAHAEVLDVLNAEGWPERVIMHCFSGNAAFAKACLAHGAWISFAGNITYKANHDMRAGLEVTPREKLLVETDAPYLAAMPNRGKPNASYLVAHTVRYVAERKGWALKEACEGLAANAEAAYGGTWG